MLPGDTEHRGAATNTCVSIKRSNKCSRAKGHDKWEGAIRHPILLGHLVCVAGLPIVCGREPAQRQAILLKCPQTRQRFLETAEKAEEKGLLLRPLFVKRRTNQQNETLATACAWRKVGLVSDAQVIVSEERVKVSESCFFVSESWLIVSE